MRRLKNLDVHEVSLVGKAANAKRYLIVKHAAGEPIMPTAARANTPVEEKLLAAFARIPQERINQIQVIAKTARARVRKAEDGQEDVGDDGGLSPDAQDAIRAAFRILAPWAEEITPSVMAEFSDAMGVESDADGESGDPEVTDTAEELPLDKSDDDNKDDDDVAKADETPEKVEDTESDPKVVAEKADDDAKDEDEEENVAKADGMPTFNDASPEDIEFGMTAARQAYAEAMKQRGLKEDAAKSADGPGLPDTNEDTELMNKSAVAKSALAHLPKEQRAMLEPILKSQESRFATLERQHRELVQKNADLQKDSLRKEFVAKAARDYPALGRAEELGQAMFRLHQSDPAGLEAWELVMKSAQARVLDGGEQGLFSELGTKLGNSNGASALDEIAKHVDSVVQKSGSSVSRHQIERDFLNTPAGKALYAQSRREAGNRSV